MSIKTIYINNKAELNKLVINNELKLSANGIALVINQIDEDDIDKFDETITIDNILYAIEEATEGDSVDSITGAGTYILAQ